MPTGAVAGLFTCAYAGEPMQRVPEVTIKAGQGIAGDRYALGRGAYSPQLPLKIRHITFITRDGVEVANEWQEASGLPAFSVEQTRRNVLLDGVSANDLNNLVGREFRVGDLKFVGVELATPCHRPSELSGLEGFVDAFERRGGLRAEACSDGVLRVGDPFTGNANLQSRKS